MLNYYLGLGKCSGKKMNSVSVKKMLSECGENILPKQKYRIHAGFRIFREQSSCLPEVSQS